MIHLIVILEKLKEMKEVTVVGGSGLIGSELIKQLIESNNISKIHVLVRKAIKRLNSRRNNLLLHRYHESENA